MARLLTHEVVAREVLNPSWSSGFAAMEPWKEELRNKEGDKLDTWLVMLFVDRMIADHDNKPPQLRKPMSYREAVELHQACGGFQHFLTSLERIAPGSEFKGMQEELKQQFKYGYLDPDILHCLNTQVPPGDLKSVSAFRTDALNMYMMCCYDCTVFPANATYVRQSGVALANILAMSPAAFCHTQFPVIQGQTSVGALVKHRRLLEDQFMRSNLNIVYNVSLLFSKPDGAGRDQRALSQQCLALVHNNYDAAECAWMQSNPVQEGKLGPVNLVRFQDFIGFDEVNRPSAQARVEQILVPVLIIKPALVLTSSYDLWVGNTSDSQLPLEPGELFGFSTGAYEDVVLRCSSHSNSNILSKSHPDLLA
eukprot:Skav228140  [mRNA]  locus=scaffold2683:22736:26272:- [translate_table: standard]